MLSDLENVQMATVVASRNGRKVTVSRVSEDKVSLQAHWRWGNISVRVRERVKVEFSYLVIASSKCLEFRRVCLAC